MTIAVKPSAALPVVSLKRPVRDVGRDGQTASPTSTAITAVGTNLNSTSNAVQEPYWRLVNRYWAAAKPKN